VETGRTGAPPPDDGVRYHRVVPQDPDAPTRAQNDSIETSIVIPCYNGADFLPEQLAAIGAQADPSIEVILSDNGSDDGSAAVAIAAAEACGLRLRVVDSSARKGINHARNVGVLASEATYILLCDCDDVVSPTWIAALVGALRSGARCVGGPLDRVYPDGRVLERAEGVHFRSWPGAGITVGSPTGANCGFVRALHTELGGFDESFIGGGDEIDFFYRATAGGAELRNVPEASILYRQRDSARGAYSQNFRYGQGSVRLHTKLAALGMPRDRPVKVVGVWVHSLLRLVTGPASARRIAVERIARRAGRARESVATRHLFL
jgi:glycosyltransferase involved in cell wall biosynthesis